MLTRLQIIVFFGLIIGTVGIWCIRSTPRKGILRILECLCAGIVLFYIISAAFIPFGIALPQSPFAAASAGVMGVPGAALAVFAQLMP